MTKEEIAELKDYCSDIGLYEPILAENVPKLIDMVEKLTRALERIHAYRSDKPDWNMIMAIAGDAIEPMTLEIYE